MNKLEALKARLGAAADVGAALALLEWDQQTYMPAKGAGARASQIATLSEIAHRMFTDPEVGALIQDLQADSLEPDDAKMVGEAAYFYERATKLPASFVQEMAAETSKGFEAWVAARKASDFAAFRPNLERIMELNRRKADLLGYEGAPYNALLEEFERGMTVEQLKVIFGELAPKQSDLVKRIAASPQQPDVAWLDQEWAECKQLPFTEAVLRDMGFDFEAGRQDKSAHPFTTNFDIQDVRVTTRIDARNFLTGLSSSVHEGGHALYEQGFQEKDRRTPLANAPSLGLHESQSRWWENMIGRSLPFWNYYFPLLQETFAGQLAGVTAEHVYQAANVVRPSLIRVDADECTYNLHIIMRFEIEVGLMDGTINVSDIPEVWNAKVKEYLGIDVPDDAHGCLQDVHWAHGAVGYFPSYALGNLYAAQMFEVTQQQLPSLWDDVAAGDFRPLLDWLRANVHVHGRRKTAREIVRDITGQEPSPEAYLRYLQIKFGVLYGI